MKSMSAIGGGLTASFVVRAFGAGVAILIAIQVGSYVSDMMGKAQTALESVQTAGSF